MKVADNVELNRNWATKQFRKMA